MVFLPRMEISNCCISYLEYICTVLNMQSVPEIKYTYKGGRLEIRSMVSSPRMELSNFFISYLDEADPRLARLAKVRGQLLRLTESVCPCTS